MDLAECTGPQASLVAPRFKRFVDEMTRVVDSAGKDEARILHFASPHVRELVAQDDWLPESVAVPVAGSYGQYLLYRDPQVRFTVVSFVWDAGAHTPIHDHTVWGIIGVLRGAEIAERFSLKDGALRSLGEATLAAGNIDRVSPRIGDIHQVRNAYPDRSSISIHVYGADLCTVERHIYCRDTGRVDVTVSKPFDNPEALLTRR